MSKTRFEVAIGFVTEDENACSQMACETYLDAFLKVMTEAFASTPNSTAVTDIVVKSGPEDSPKPLYKADIRDYSNKKHFS